MHRQCVLMGFYREIILQGLCEEQPLHLVKEMHLSPELTHEVGFGLGASSGGCWLCWTSAQRCIMFLLPSLLSTLEGWDRSVQPELTGELGGGFPFSDPLSTQGPPASSV